MSEPVIASKTPTSVDLEPGEYWWCSCGRSKSQPFCDGSHAGTDFEPMRIEVKEKSSFYLCNCKHTQNPPYCDGAHDLLD